MQQIAHHQDARGQEAAGVISIYTENTTHKCAPASSQIFSSSKHGKKSIIESTADHIHFFTIGIGFLSVHIKKTTWTFTILTPCMHGRQ